MLNAITDCSFPTSRVYTHWVKHVGSKTLYTSPAKYLIVVRYNHDSWIAKIAAKTT